MWDGRRRMFVSRPELGCYGVLWQSSRDVINREVRRCSLAFKRRVLEEVESGKFASIQAAGVHHGTIGATTVNGWIRRFGKNHLLAKVVPVEQVDEADRVMELRGQVARLEKALGGAQAESLLNTEYLRIACERIGSRVEENHCYENAKAERLNGILRQEFGLGERFVSKGEVPGAVREAVGLYNDFRPHGALANCVPMAAHRAGTA